MILFHFVKLTAVSLVFLVHVYLGCGFLFFHRCLSLSHQGVEAGLEEERLQRERQETQWVSEAEARAQVLRVKAELKAQERQAVQLESSCRAVDRSLGQSSKKLQVRHTHAFRYLFVISFMFFMLDRVT